MRPACLAGAVTSAATPRTRLTSKARRRLAALIVLAATLSTAASATTTSATTTSAARGGCAQPYKPMWIFVAGIGVEVDPWPLHPHDPPFWAGDIGQPGGPTIIGGTPPYSYEDGVLTVGEGDDAATFEGRSLSSDVGVGLVEFEGRRHLVLQSTNKGPSWKAIAVFWDFDDPCRQLPDTSAAPTTSVPPTDDAGSPAGPADPVSGAARYTG